MRLFPFLVLLLLSPLHAIGQVNMDALSNVWENQSNVATIRLEAIHQIYTKGYLYSKPDSAFLFAQMAYDFAKSKNLPKEMALARRYMGIASSLQANYAKAIDLLAQTIEIEKQNKNEEGLSKALNSLGNVYLRQSDYANAIDCYRASLKIAEEQENKETIKSLLNNIALVYMDLEEHDQSLAYLDRALSLSKEMGTSAKEFSLFINIGTVYRKKKEYQKALEFYEQGLLIKENSNSQFGLATCYSNMGLIYEEFGERQKALDFFKQSMELHRGVGDKKGIANCLIHFGTLYQNTNPDSSIVLAKQALELAQETGSVEEISDAAELLFNIYEAKGENKLAIDMNKVFHDAKDSMYSIRNQKAVLVSEFKSQEEKAQIKYTEELQAQRKKTYRERLIGISGIILLLGALAYFSFTRYKRYMDEKKRLLNKIDLLKKNLAAQAISSTGKRTTIALDKAKIEKFIDAKLGESSWMILNIIFAKPSVSNKEIAKEVSLSVEGVSSSLRRMYSSFKIISSSSKKIALITEAVRISAEE